MPSKALVIEKQKQLEQDLMNTATLKGESEPASVVLNLLLMKFVMNIIGAAKIPDPIGWTGTGLLFYLLSFL